MAALPHQPATRGRSEWHAMVEADDASEPLPEAFDTVGPRFLQVSQDKLSVRYTGKGNHTQDVGAIRCALAAPPPARAARRRRAHALPAPRAGPTTRARAGARRTTSR